MSKHLYLISYILDNQPGTCEVHSDEPELSQEAARQHLQGALGAQSSAFTDVQVQRQAHEHEPGTSPGHHQQP